MSEQEQLELLRSVLTRAFEKLQPLSSNQRDLGGMYEPQFCG